MSNKWKLTDEVRAEWHEKVKSILEWNEKSDRPFEEDYYNTSLTPYTLKILLEELGYAEEDIHTNGWQMDFSIVMAKKNHKPIMISGCGITFSLSLQDMED